MNIFQQLMLRLVYGFVSHCAQTNVNVKGVLFVILNMVRMFEMIILQDRGRRTGDVVIWRSVLTFMKF